MGRSRGGPAARCSATRPWRRRRQVVRHGRGLRTDPSRRWSDDPQGRPTIGRSRGSTLRPLRSRLCRDALPQSGNGPSHSLHPADDHLSSGLSARNVTPAAIPASTWATRYIQSVGQANMPITAAPSDTAGLKAPPEIAPTANAPAPIPSGENGLPLPTAAPPVKTNKKVPLASTAYFTPARGPITTLAASPPR